MSDPTFDPTPAPAQQGALSQEREAKIRRWSRYRWLCHEQDGHYGQDVDVLLTEIDMIREQHGQTIADLKAKIESLSNTNSQLVASQAGYARALSERGTELDEARQALADERAATARLRDQISTARAQLDAWQDNRPGATVQAATATLAASPGPEAPEPAALEDDRLVTVGEGEPWVQRFNEQHLSPWCPGCRCLYAGPHAKDCPYLDCTEPREAE